MENEADAPPRLSPSERIWANSVISAIIIEQSDTPTLLALLRVNKVAFGLAVSQVYRSMRGPENTLKILRKVRNSTRCQAYARAVRHLSAANIYDHNIGYLCLSLPKLRSMSAPRVEKNNLLRLQWSVDACGEVRHAECVLSGLVKGDEWERTVAQSKALLPDDRRIQFRPALVVITDTASLARWIQSSQEGLLLPLKLFVDDLDLSCWDQVLAHIRTLPPTTHVVEELIVALGPDREEQSVARIPWLGPEMPQTVSILSKISKALTISGRPMRSAGTPRLHTALRSFRQVSFGIHLSCAKDTEDLFSWNVRPVLADVLRTSLQRHPIRFIVTAWLIQAQRPADSLSTILAGVISDRQWLWALARSLRQAASCFSRHQLKIVCIGYPDESKHAEANRKASVQLTDRLNDTIEIISQCARDMQPRSFEKVSRHRPPSVQSDPTGDTASRVSVKGQHVDERESGQNLEAAAAVAEEDRTS